MTTSPASSAEAATSQCPADGRPAAFRARINGYDLYRCDHCSLTFVPTRQLVDVDYDALYKAEGGYASKLEQADAMESGEAPSLLRYRREIIDSMRGDPPGRALEIGCGVGDFLRVLETLGTTCFGTEMSANAAERARKLVKGEVAVAPFDATVFPGQKFDAIFLWEVIEHVSDLRQMFAEIFRRLAPGGRLVLSTPNYQSRLMWEDVPRDPRATPPVHVTFWTRRALELFLRELGFSSVGVRAVSWPRNPLRRAGGGRLAELRVATAAQLLPSRRRTLVAEAVK